MAEAPLVRQSPMHPAPGGQHAAGASRRDRLRWQCRRGMLELDLLLSAFLETGYEQLNQADRQHFVELLDYPDPLLLEWLMGRIVPADREVIRLVEIIRQAAAD